MIRPLFVILSLSLTLQNEFSDQKNYTSFVHNSDSPYLKNNTQLLQNENFTAGKENLTQSYSLKSVLSKPIFQLSTPVDVSNISLSSLLSYASANITKVEIEEVLFTPTHFMKFVAPCDTSIIKNKCTWDEKKSFVYINASVPCIFSCTYNPSKDKLVRLNAHLLSNPLGIKIFVSARQNHYLNAWTLPIIFPEHGESQPFSSFESLLCPPRFNLSETIYFDIEMYAEANVEAILNISLTTIQYEMQLNEIVTVTSTPASPWYKFYDWMKDQESVLVTAESASKSGHNVCALLSLQNAQCPVGTDERSIVAGGGRYQSFQERGGMVAKRSMFPNGIFIVILPLPDDYLCTGIEEVFENKTSRTKSVRLQVIPRTTMSDNWGTFLAVGIFISIAAFGSTFICHVFIRSNLQPENPNLREDSEEVSLLDNHDDLNINERRIKRTRFTFECFVPGLGGNSEAGGASGVQHEGGSQHGDDTGTVAINDIPDVPRGILEHIFYLEGIDDHAIDGHSQNYTVPQILNNEIMDPRHPVDLIKVTNQFNPRSAIWWKVLAEYESETPESKLAEVGFQNNFVMLAAFMALPFSEILRTYLHVFTDKGSEDQCFYNTRCLISFGIFPDFARVFTNVGYLLCGICYGFTLRKHRKLNLVASHSGALGVSRNYGLFMSLAVGLVIQFLMSGLYHVCPNQVTFRFDMMFMYVNAIVLVVGIWGLRHGGVSHHVYPSVGLVGGALLAAELKDWVSHTIFWVILGSIHAFLTFTIATMMFKMGTWSFNPVKMFDMWKEWRPILASFKEVLREENADVIKPWSLFRVILGITVNISLIVVGWAVNVEIYMYILIACLLNMGFYAGNYICTKKLYGEKGTLISWVSLGLALLLWITAISFYLIHNTDSESTPAASRAMNSDCILFGVFDAHDIWHVTSAFALFATFMGILTLDDDLANKNPKYIPVF